MPIISIINIKGGVGKTQCTINIGGEMSRLGHRVLLIDTDCQSSLTQILNINAKYNMYDLYSNSRVWPQDCMQQYDNNLFAIGNIIESSMLETELNQKRIKETILNNSTYAVQEER